MPFVPKSCQKKTKTQQKPKQQKRELSPPEILEYIAKIREKCSLIEAELVGRSQEEALFDTNESIAVPSTLRLAPELVKEMVNEYMSEDLPNPPQVYTPSSPPSVYDRLFSTDPQLHREG